MRTDPLAFLGTELDNLKQQNLYRKLRILEEGQEATTRFDGRSVVNLSSNNYLGLTTHPLLREKAIEAVRQFGAGSGSVRTIAGTMAIHMELERRLAAFKKTEAVVVFQSGFAAKPLWNTTTASVFLKAARRRSSSMWIAMVPAIVLTDPDPAPNWRTASIAFSRSSGWVVSPR